jgi:hypothetical protein
VSPRVFRPSRRRNAFRWAFGLVLCALAAAMFATGYWVGVIPLVIGLWPLSVAALITFGRDAYRLELDDRGFRVNDLFGRVAHDVAWHDVRALAPVGMNAYSFIVVGWQLADGEGHMPDTYGVKTDDLMNLMWSYWNERRVAAPAASPAFEAF